MLKAANYMAGIDGRQSGGNDDAPRSMATFLQGLGLEGYESWTCLLETVRDSLWTWHLMLGNCFVFRGERMRESGVDLLARPGLGAAVGLTPGNR
ncbi:hypothetical protein TOPH_08992 [Tolypocladium ophioglossoides CBS 100239]|uniref:Uncharacterized protein n=1 Tax=Tolypocladium ophioglossoides (strain CBS 100239) TaxID=1163406 RepID=A0A0L0MX04_TOLOC|nr:hypothetical protein TOPH_08992 [Tolypocladium ophioglossoides CBS 100239]